MLHRGLALSGIALCALSLACMDQSNGDPARDFQSGTGTYPPSGGTGYAGRHGTGYAGSSGSAGGTGTAGASGATGSAGADGGAGAGPTDGGGATEGGAAGSASGDAGGGAGGSGGAKGTPPAACVVGATATFSLAWTLEDETRAESTCDRVGGKTVDIDFVNVSTGAESLMTFSCAAGAATTCAATAGQYHISMKLRDAGGNVLSEIVAWLEFLVDGQNTAVTSLPFEVGGDTTKGRGFAATWSIDQVSTHAIESCAQAGAASVRLSVGQTTFDLPCTNGRGRTTPVDPGNYSVNLELLDSAMSPLSVTQTMSVSIAANQLVFLGDVPFDVN
jgi:hypothetical protein